MTVWSYFDMPVAMADGGNVRLPPVCWHDRWRRFPRVTGRETEARVRGIKPYYIRSLVKFTK